MSKLRPGPRDRLEAQYLDTARKRSALATEIEKLDADLLQMQRQLDGIEAPRNPVRHEDEGRKDALDKVRPGHLVVMDGGPSEAAETTLHDAMSGDPSAAGAYDDEWRVRCLRITAMSVGILRMIRRPEEKTPKLAAHVALLALGVDCESMHHAAAAYGLSTERVRQRVEEIRIRFNLPKNQHNKSEEAVMSYKTTAALFKKGAA